MVIVAIIITLLYLIQYCFLVRVSREACPDCELEAASRTVSLPIIQRMSQTAQISQPGKSMTRVSNCETDARGLTSFEFVNTRNVLKHISDLEMRVKRGNSMAKSAIKQLEYTVIR